MLKHIALRSKKEKVKSSSLNQLVPSFSHSSSHVGKILKLLFLAASIKTMLEAQIACFIYW